MLINGLIKVKNACIRYQVGALTKKKKVKGRKPSIFVHNHMLERYESTVKPMTIYLYFTEYRSISVVKGH